MPAVRPHRLEDQDVALSRPRQEFESPWGHLGAHLYPTLVEELGMFFSCPCRDMLLFAFLSKNVRIRVDGFEDAIRAVFPQTIMQLCVIHQIRNCLRYVYWKDRKGFMAELKLVHQASTREQTEANLIEPGGAWNDQYAMR